MATTYYPVSGRQSMPCNVAAQQTLASFICNARNVSKAIRIRCHVGTEVVQNARTMKSVNGWIASRKSYCPLSILW